MPPTSAPEPSCCAATAPACAIADLLLERQLAFDLIRDARADLPQTQIVVYTAIDDVTYIERCLQLARGIRRQIAMHRRTARGCPQRHRRKHLHLDQKSYSELMAKNGAIGSRSRHVEKLSPSELRAFHFIGRERPVAEIARTPHRSINTIETYRTRIKNKLGLKHASELSYFAFQHSLMTQGLEV